MNYLGRMSTSLVALSNTMQGFAEMLTKLEAELKNSPYLAQQNPQEASEIEKLEALKELAGSTP
tara:strand:- start:28 stop:219 length:192 start_codon:yes stop_codon:yes gene_type:complete